VNRRTFTLTAAAFGTLWLAGCKDKPAASEASSNKPAAVKKSPQEAYELATQASGFTVGSVMAANTVYVFFDPACPHCAQLWANAKPLHNRLKMVWIPLGWLRPASGPQSATILSASDPAAAMEENERLVLERKGGITASQNLSDEVKGKIKANTDLFNSLGAESVPLIVYKNAQSGQFGMHPGAVDAATLSAMVGI
jgi:thiol:disulfide interchange protein DsbG